MAIIEASVERELGQEKICVKRRKDLHWLLLTKKNEISISNAYLKITRQEQRKCFSINDNVFIFKMFNLF